MITPEKQVEFLARITASTTHEIRNVLAIIKESAGLMDDIVRSDQPVATNRDRLERAMGRIDAQVRRGVDLISYLNRLAHSVDRGEAPVDLGEEVHQATALSQRFARTKGHQVRVLAGEDGLGVTTNPLGLQMALVAVAEACLTRLSAPGVVNIRPVRHERCPGIEFTIEAGGHPVSYGLESGTANPWDDALGEIGATVVETRAGGLRILPGGTGCL